MTGRRTRGDSGVFTWRRPRRWSSSCRTCWRAAAVTRSPARAHRSVAGLLRRRRVVAADVHVALRLERLGGEDREPCCSPRRWPCGGCGPGRCAWTWRPLPTRWPPDEDAEPVELPWPADWDELADSPLVAVGADAPWRPLRLVDGRLYLDRYWQQEQLVRRELDRAGGAAGRRFRPVPPGRDLRRRPRRTGSGSPRRWPRAAG